MDSTERGRRGMRYAKRIIENNQNYREDGHFWSCCCTDHCTCTKKQMKCSKCEQIKLIDLYHNKDLKNSAVCFDCNRFDI